MKSQGKYNGVVGGGRGVGGGVGVGGGGGGWGGGGGVGGGGWGVGGGGGGHRNRLVLPSVRQSHFCGFSSFPGKPLKGLIYYSVTPQDWWSRSDQSSPFPDLWLVEGMLCIFRKKQLWSDIAQVWYTNSRWDFSSSFNFGHPTLNSHRFLASNWLRSFCAFADILLIALSPNVVDLLNTGLPHRDENLLIRWISVVIWLLIGRAVLVTNSWSDWAEIL